MYTKNSCYLNNDVMQKFMDETVKNANLMKIIDHIMAHFHCPMFLDIMKTNQDYQIDFQNQEALIKAIINGKDKTLTYLSNQMTIKHHLSPDLDIMEGVTYSKNNRHIDTTLACVKRYNIKYYDEKQKYSISIIPQNEAISTKKVISNLLDENRSMVGIRDIFYAINEVVPLDKVLLNIQSADKKEIIYYVFGILANYVELRKIGNIEEKTYLQDGDFYFEKTMIDKLDDKHAPLLKKIGKRYE